jgi:hypothetical protein
MACRSSTAWDAPTNQIAEDSGENGETVSRVRLLGGSGAVAQGEPWYAASVWLQPGAPLAHPVALAGDAPCTNSTSGDRTILGV